MGVIEVTAAVLGWILLGIFFRAVETTWPHSYYSISDVVAQRVSATSLRYLAFRLGPVLAVSFFVAVSVVRLRGSVESTLALLVILHIGTSNARSFLAILRRKEAFGRMSQLGVHVAVAFGILAVAVFAALLSRIEKLHLVVPGASELAETLWTAVFAGTIGAFLLRVSRAGEIEHRELMRRSRDALGTGLWDLATETAARFGTDVDLVRAILLVENLQRPPWVRRLERLKGTVFPKGTYGVMQVQADSPLNDAESIRRAVATRLSGIRIPRDGEKRLRSVLRSYNSDRIFVDLAADFYYELKHRADDDSDLGNEGRRLRERVPLIIASLGIATVAAGRLWWKRKRSPPPSPT